MATIALYNKLYSAHHADEIGLELLWCDRVPTINQPSFQLISGAAWTFQLYLLLHSLPYVVVSW